MNPDDYAYARRQMIDKQLVAHGITDTRLLEVMGSLPRHWFVDEALEPQAYGDYPIGIGEGQTISQPYIVALMTEALHLKGAEKVLEIGTGCGYQTAVLSFLVKQVYTIERLKSLGLKARSHLKKLNIRNVVLRIGDGTHGWPETMPFDAIISAAGGPDIPQPLVDQLAEGGRLIVPVGTQDQQRLLRVTKAGEKLETDDLGPCRFVKLVGDFGWKRQRHAGEKFVKRSLV